MGELEAPWGVWILRFPENPEKHVVLLEVATQEKRSFFRSVDTQIADAGDDQALVFIHGYNTTFEDAARRTGQLAYDLGVGTPILYSWPSQGTVAGYTIDETNNEWTRPHLIEFLSDLRSEVNTDTVHLVAHSMGNRSLTHALESLAGSGGDAPMFRQVALMAPDIDADVFQRLAPAFTGTADRITLYASCDDQALAASKTVHGYPRAGDACAPGPVVVPGIDTVDVTGIDLTFLSHSYYGDSRNVIYDLFHLLTNNLPPGARGLLGVGDHWAIRR